MTYLWHIQHHVAQYSEKKFVLIQCTFYRRCQFKFGEFPSPSGLRLIPSLLKY
ncbi:hypothetical protein BDR04DRAFT_1109544 [Suillus decipiens]|nr:hypothetical protein BDR04DRAFT_1109544 [Suillus decipiens]